MQRERDYTTIGIGLLFVVFAVMGNAYPWISVPLLALAILLMVWGRERRRVEIFVGRLPAGQYLLKGLDQLDLIISSRADLQFRLFVTAEVDDQFFNGGKKLDGRIIIENTFSEPLEYGPAVFRASFQNDTPKIINSWGQVLRPQESVHYRFEFDERAMTKGDGSVGFAADIDYGLPSNRAQRLHKKMEVKYTVGDQGFITRSAVRTLEDQDIAI